MREGDEMFLWRKFSCIRLRILSIFCITNDMITPRTNITSYVFVYSSLVGVASVAVGVALEDANRKELFTQVLY
jgi:hypothetical protein